MSDVKPVCNKDPDPAGCLEKAQALLAFTSQDEQVVQYLARQALREKVTTSFNSIFKDQVEGFAGADVLSEAVIEQDNLFSNVTLLFTLNRASSSNSPAARVATPEEVLDKLLTKCNERSALDKAYCVLPSGLAFKRTALNDAKSEQLDPCNSSINFCSPGSVCEHVRTASDWSFPHNCTCRSGYRVEQVSFFNVAEGGSGSSSDKRIRKEFCVDIDECAAGLPDICPANSTCANTDGGFECPCLSGLKHAKLGEGDGETCVEVCFNVTCGSGTCGVHRSLVNDYECSCHDGFRGIHCELEDEKVKQFRTTVTIVSVGLSLLLVAAIIGAIIIYKRAKKNENETYYGADTPYARPQFHEKRPHTDTQF